MMWKFVALETMLMAAPLSQKETKKQRSLVEMLGFRESFQILKYLWDIPVEIPTVYLALELR